MRKKIGIDLGTTNTLPSVFDMCTLKGECWANRSGSRSTPSVVNIDGNGRYVVGSIAKQNALLYPENTIANFKRMMGKTKSAFTVGGVSYSPQFLSALVLMSIKKDMEAYLGTEDFDVVITVPAYFDSDACQATKEAGMLAGMNVVDIIHEPLAAVYHYASELDLENQTILVVDLGGGTFDVAVVRVEENEIVELVIDGCLELGGNDWDEAMLSYIKQTYLTGKKMEPDDEQELIMSVEKAKKMLSERNETRLVARTSDGREMIRITREEFEKCTEHLLMKVKTILENVKNETKKKEIGDIDKVFLVGGATRMPQIEALVKSEELFSDAEVLGRDHDEAVARGAAVYAQIFSENKEVFRPKKLKRISAYSYGLKALMNTKKREVKINNMIRKNTELPITVPRQFQTAEDGQQGVDLSIYENTSEETDIELYEGTLLGNGKLEIKENLLAGSNLVVTFTLKEDGTLYANAEEPKGKTKAEVVIEPKALLGSKEFLVQKQKLDEMKSQ